MSYAMSDAVSAVPNDYGQRAGFRQPDDGLGGLDQRASPTDKGHRRGPARREGSA
jgi:hypothetical protein